MDWGVVSTYDNTSCGYRGQKKKGDIKTSFLFRLYILFARGLFSLFLFFFCSFVLFLPPLVVNQSNLYMVFS